MYKQVQFKIQGMTRDNSVSVFDNRFAYENKNIRIMATDDNTALSIVNEKGNALLRITGEAEGGLGVVLGHAVLNGDLILFTTNEGTDTIYKLNLRRIQTGGHIISEVLFQGQLGFDYRFPIETIPYYESDEIKKVYWVDGKNPIRVITYSKDIDPDDNTQFNFVPSLNLGESITITKEQDTSGKFNSGTIQYFFTYFNKFGSESSIFYTSPLFYISPPDRGEAVNNDVNCSFDIQIANIDPKFKYVRVYSLHTSTKDTSRAAYLVTEIKILEGVQTISYKDTGIANVVESIAPTDLLYKAVDTISPSTLTHKDNRLFIGNFKLLHEELSEADKTAIINGITFEQSYKDLDYEPAVNYYPYVNNLNKDSAKIKSFKGGEWYRLAVQFQREDGSFTSPIYKGDYLVHNYPKILDKLDTPKIQLPSFQLRMSREAKAILDNNNLKRIRVLRVPLENKSIVCQGVLCPTLFNVKDRAQNSPYNISSWFMRPIGGRLEYRHETALPSNEKTNGEIQSARREEPIFVDPIIFNDTSASYELKYHYYEVEWVKDSFEKHYEAELYIGGIFRKRFVNTSYNKIKEAILNEGVPTVPKESSWKLDYPDADDTEGKGNLIRVAPLVIDKELNKRGANYYVDQSVVTFHSPDIEKFQNRLSGNKFSIRIVGIVPITSNSTSYNIVSGKPRADRGVGVNTANLNLQNKSYNANGFINYPLWNDNLQEEEEELYNYVVYTWHREGSLNNDDGTRDIDDLDKERTAQLDSKIISNLRYSYSSIYSPRWGTYGFSAFSNIYDINLNNPVEVFNDTELSNIRLTSSLPVDGNTINYYGNVNKQLPFVPYQDAEGNHITGYPIRYADPDNPLNYVTGDNLVEGVDPIDIKFKSSPHVVLSLEDSNHDIQVLPKLWIGTSSASREYNTYSQENGTRAWNLGKIPSYVQISYVALTPGLLPNDSTIKSGVFGLVGDLSSDTLSPNPDIAIYQYTGTAWVEYAGYESNQLWLYINNGEPIFFIMTQSRSGNTIVRQEAPKGYMPFNQGRLALLTDSDIDYSIYSGFLYLAELYDPTLNDNIYGGSTPEDLQKHQWVPASNLISLSSAFDYDDNDYTTIIGEGEFFGDTYFMRWDCLKTYPYNDSHTNQLVDITSFMVETSINLDGRYDKRRGLSDQTSSNITNFNLINDVYSQEDNLFTYRMLDERFSKNSFPTTFAWSLQKTNNAFIDSWTKLLTSSSMDLEGDKGKINALRVINGNIYAFQDTGIASILFNNRVQISPNEGLPIEIANSNKVEGFSYISDKIGCSNKWSICNAEGITYFVDNYVNGIYATNGQEITNISDKLGFHSWMQNNKKGTKAWNPVDFNNFITFYDKENKEVLFTTNDACLGYSTILSNFTSFYDYEGVTQFVDILDESTGDPYKLQIKDGAIWAYRMGNYNRFFGEFKPFHTTVIVNESPHMDKTFNTLEFRSDSWDNQTLLSDTTFDTLETWNEYQRGTSSLVFTKGAPSNLKKKFRIWRANIPRDNSNGKDRMRNPWLYLKLSMNNENTNKTVLHDMIVSYFEN